MSHTIKVFAYTVFSILIMSCSNANESQVTESQEAKKTIKEITVDELSQDILSSHLIIDVRESSELSAGVIPGSIHIPMGDIASKLPEYLISNSAREHTGDLKSKPVLLYCAGGVRSYKSAETLKKLGFTNLSSLSGGYNAYAAKINQ